MPEFEEDASNLFFTVGYGDNGFFPNPNLFRDGMVVDDDRLWITMPGVVLHVFHGRLPVGL